jgi:hypothetical protein
MDLARGYVALGEHVQALVCLERAARDAPGAPGLLPLIEELLEVWGPEHEHVACRGAAEALRAHLLECSQRFSPPAPAISAAPRAPVAPPEPAENPPNPFGGAGGADVPLDAPLDALLDAALAEAEVAELELLDTAPEPPLAAPWSEGAPAGLLDPAAEADSGEAPGSGFRDWEVSEPNTEPEMELVQEVPPAEPLRAPSARSAQRIRALERWLEQVQRARPRAGARA